MTQFVSVVKISLWYVEDSVSSVLGVSSPTCEEIDDRVDKSTTRRTSHREETKCDERVP